MSRYPRQIARETQSGSRVCILVVAGDLLSKMARIDNQIIVRTEEKRKSFNLKLTGIGLKLLGATVNWRAV